MEILVAILIIALIVAVGFIAMQRRPAGARGLGRPRTSPIGRRDRGVPRQDPMAAAVVEHAQATDPQDAVVAEQRLRAQANQVAAGLHTEAAHRSEHERASDRVGHRGSYAGDPRMAGNAEPAGARGPADTNPSVDPVPGPAYGEPRSDDHIDPATGAHTDRHEDPEPDSRSDDPRYDGRLAGDYVDPRPDDRSR